MVQSHRRVGGFGEGRDEAGDRFFSGTGGCREGDRGARTPNRRRMGGRRGVKRWESSKLWMKSQAARFSAMAADRGRARGSRERKKVVGGGHVTWGVRWLVGCYFTRIT